MRRRVVDHIPAARGRAPAQARLRRAARRRVRRPAAPARARPRRRAIRAPTTLSALAELTRRRVRRPRGRRGAARGLRLPAHARAPHPAAPAAPHPRRARRRGVAAPARPQHGLPQGPGRRSSTRPGSTTAARCAGCTRSSSTARCSPRSPGSPATRRGSRPRPPSERLAALGYADPRAALRHLEALTTGVTRTAADPAHAAAGDAGVVRRRARPGRRAVRLPADQRVARLDARGTSPRCATRARSPSGWPGCWPPRATPPTCWSASRRACGCSAATCSRCPPRR